MKKKSSKSTKLLQWMLTQKKGVKYGAMQRFYWLLNGSPQSITYERRDGDPSYRPYKVEGCSRGYFCDAIAILKDRNIIEKIKTKDGNRYFVSIVGKLNIATPMASRENQKLNTKAKLYLANIRIKYLEKQSGYYFDFYYKNWQTVQDAKNDQSTNKKTLIEIREYVDMVTRGIH